MTEILAAVFTATIIYSIIFTVATKPKHAK